MKKKSKQNQPGFKAISTNLILSKVSKHDVNPSHWIKPSQNQ